MSENRKFYGIDEDIQAILIQNGMINDLFYYQDLQERRLFLEEEVTQPVVSEIVRNILRFNQEDKGKDASERKPIMLFVSTVGGDVEAGSELIDVIMNSKTPVYTINIGFQYSMGFIIGLAGHKRFASKNAKYLIHDGYESVGNSSYKAQDRMEFNKRIEERDRQFILDRTKITPEEFNANSRIEWYMFAHEAKEKGITDYIIGEDCTLDEII